MDIGVLFVLGFGIVNIISDVFGVNPMVSIFGNAFRHQGLITLLSGIIIFSLLRSPLLFKKLLPVFRKTIIASALIISSIAILQAVQVNVFKNFTIPTYNGRIVGTFGNPNFLGSYLTVLLPFALWYKQKINKLLRLTIVLTIIIAIFYTDSRAAYIALAFLFLVYALYLLSKSNLSKSIIWSSVILVFLGLFAFLNLFVYKSVIFNDSAPVIKERGCPESWPVKYPLKIITDIRSLIPNFKREAPCDNRFLIWAVGLEALIKRPVIGYGQDNFEQAILAGRMHLVDNAHNIFLETAISSGLLGLLFYLLIIFYALRKASFDIKMSLLAFIIIGQFNPLSIAQISLFWILIGFSQRENNSK